MYTIKKLQICNFYLNNLKRWINDSKKQKIRAFATVSKSIDHVHDKYESRIQF